MHGCHLLKAANSDVERNILKSTINLKTFIYGPVEASDFILKNSIKRFVKHSSLSRCDAFLYCLINTEWSNFWGQTQLIQQTKTHNDTEIDRHWYRDKKIHKRNLRQAQIQFHGANRDDRRHKEHKGQKSKSDIVVKCLQWEGTFLSFIVWHPCILGDAE